MNYQLTLAQLKGHEGLKLIAYKCSEGYWTIAYGRNLETKGLSPDECLLIFGKQLNKSEAIESLKTKSLTLEQAEELLLNDVAEVEEQVFEQFGDLDLNEPREAVLINMSFNLGFAGLLKFKNMIAAISSGDFEKASTEMLDSRWADQVGNRAKELAEQMKTGEWQL